MTAADVCEKAATYFAKKAHEAYEVDNEERALAFEEARRYFLPSWVIEALPTQRKEAEQDG